MKPTFLIIGLHLSSVPGALSGVEITAAQRDFFEAKIRPLLAENCYKCHNSIDKKKGDIALDYAAALEESDVIVPGNPGKSRLILSVRHAEDVEQMPSKAPKLSNLSIKHLEEWIEMGAPDPRLTKPTKAELAGKVDWEAARNQRMEWWSFQPITKSPAPVAADPQWNKNEIDRFIYAGFKAKEMEGAPLADPATLARRLHLILTGLPPKPEVVDKFVAHPTEQAYAVLVDELMKSPRYGERWGRYWMDWYRYAETHGSEGDPEIPYVKEYRDYLIRAIDADIPYDQLIREHLAGDLLKSPRLNADLGINESAIGPAQLRLVPHGFGVTNAYDEQITFTDNQIDVISKAMLGVTVSCARCHDHKFDPISQKDYYKFYGIMVSSRPAIVNVDSPTLQNLHRLEIEKLKSTIRREFSTEWLGEVDAAIGKLEKLDQEKIGDNHPLGAWTKLRDLDPDAIKTKIDEMSNSYQKTFEHNEVAKKNATFYANLRDQATYDHWFHSGNGLGAKVSPAGSFALAGDGDNTFIGIYPSGIYSHLISDKHSGLLNSIFHLAKGKNASLRAFGAGASARFIIRSYPLIHGGLHPTANLRPEPVWMNFHKYEYWNGEQGYFQINTAADSTANPGGERSWFGLLEAYAGNEGMRELGTPLAALASGTEKITDRSSLLLFYKNSLRAAISAWRDESITDPQAQLLDAFVNRGMLSNNIATLTAPLKSLVETYRNLEHEIRKPTRAPGVMEGEPWEQPLLARGDYKKEGDPVPRGFLEFLPGKPYPKTSSGRLELADDILSDRNPLTARVIVNRLWHHTFGRGIVDSADNFGRLGNEPSNPQLLDFLAADFREDGWSMKSMVRSFVMSRTFRSASAAPPENGDKDQQNLLLAYFTPRRLDAEAILDSVRFVAANNTPRRAIYNTVERNNLDSFLTSFNFPIPTSTVGVRTSTNVPAQALTMMNGRIVEDAARQWTKRIMDNNELATPEAKINAIFMQAYARHASPQEIASCLEYIGSDPGASTKGDSFFRITHAILNSKELIYVN